MTRPNAELPLFFTDEKTGLLDDNPSRVQGFQERTRKRRFRGVALITLGLLLSTLYFKYGRLHRCFSAESEVTTTGVALPKKVQRAWAAYSPYFPADEYKAPPERCEIVQVNLLQRHGTRFPTAKSSKKMKEPLQKLINAKSYAHKRYEFLKYFEWDLGEDDLLPIGAQEAFDAGSEHYLRYRHLLGKGQLPFVRASDSERVVYSALNWSEGFATASALEYRPRLSVILPEETGANNTLDDSMCPNFESNKKPAHAWRDKFVPPIVKRLNKAIKGAKLDEGDIIELMPLCAFETHFHGSGSEICGLFTGKEWLAREYYEDLVKYYKTGHGNPLGPVQGTGYINELLSRLTTLPVQDATQTNHTLDNSPITFPLDRTFYADFSHDNQMVAIYSAMGLFKSEDGEAPSDEEREEGRVWRVSRMVPFSGRMITEKLSCVDESDANEAGPADESEVDADAEVGDEKVDSVGKKGRKEYVRILVNDAIQPLPFCGSDEDGLCELGAFVESQGYSRRNGDGDWERCFS